jgi:hypothetical protein
MKLRTCIFSSALALASLASQRAQADTDAGPDGGSADAGATEAEPTSPPLACDGALCDTTTGSECAVPRGTGRASAGGVAAMMACAVAVVIAARRARRAAREVGE